MKTPDLSLKLPDPGFLHASGINQFTHPLQQGLVLLVELVVQNFVLLQNKGEKISSPEAMMLGLKFRHAWGLAGCSRIKLSSNLGSKHGTGKFFCDTCLGARGL